MLTLPDKAVILVAVGSLLLLLLLQQSCVYMVRNLLSCCRLFRQRPSLEIPATANDSFKVLAEPIRNWLERKRANSFSTLQDVQTRSMVAAAVNASQLYEPCIHVVVDEWIDHGIAHGQPVEAEEDMLHVLGRSDLPIDKLVDKVAVIGKPTHSEQQDDNDKHLHHLRYTSR